MSQQRIKELEQQISDLQEEIDNFELDPDDFIDQYEESIRMNNGDVVINGIEYDPVYVLKKIDKPAYNESLNNYVGSLDKESESEYQNLLEELADLQYDLDELLEKEQS